MNLKGFGKDELSGLIFSGHSQATAAVHELRIFKQGRSNCPSTRRPTDPLF